MSTASSARIGFRGGRSRTRSRLFRSEDQRPEEKDERRIFGKPDDEAASANGLSTSSLVPLKGILKKSEISHEKRKLILMIAFRIMQAEYIAALQEHKLNELFEKYLKVDDKVAPPPATPDPVSTTHDQPPSFTSSASTSIAVSKPNSSVGARNAPASIKKILKVDMSTEQVLQRDINRRNTRGHTVRFAL